jgi:hypothetical protein
MLRPVPFPLKALLRPAAAERMERSPVSGCGRQRQEQRRTLHGIMTGFASLRDRHK